MIELEHEGEAETDMRFGSAADDDPIMMLYSVFIYIFGFGCGAIAAGIVMWL